MTSKCRRPKKPDPLKLSICLSAAVQFFMMLHPFVSTKDMEGSITGLIEQALAVPVVTVVLFIIAFFTRHNHEMSKKYMIGAGISVIVGGGLCALTVR